MSRDEIIKYWQESAEVDFQAMETLFKNGHFVWALFVGHLVIEKLLKAYYVKRVCREIFAENHGVQGMVAQADKQIVIQKVEEYIKRLRENHIDIWRLYLYGSYAKETYRRDSDIDLAVFLNKEDIDAFEECRLLMRLRWDVDLSIEPHCFAKSDYDETDPYIKEIIKTGMRFI